MKLKDTLRLFLDLALISTAPALFVYSFYFRKIKQEKKKESEDILFEIGDTATAHRDKTISLEPFDTSKIKKGDNIFIIGETGKGKTKLVKNLMNKRIKNNGAMVELIISPTETLERQYIPEVKSGIIYRKYHKDFVSKFITKQVENIGDFVIDDTKESVVILDNCLRHSEDSELIDLVSNGVFYQTVNIITMSSALGVSEQFDSCMDYIFVFNTTHYIYIKCLYKKYFKDILKFEDFKELIHDIKEDHSCLVIDCKDSGKLYFYNSHD